ncbi:MAG: RDD family protein [Oligoflexia bacterium]|nr:RDD family protein [Oligoflexia bacterium]
MKTGSLRPAGFWLRLLAHLIDNAVLMGASLLSAVVALGVATWLRSEGGDPLTLERLDAARVQAGLVVIYVMFALPYYVLLHFRLGATLGKLALRLRVEDASGCGPLTLGQAVVRFFAYGVSWFLFAGFLLAALPPRKRALHDWIAGTVVVRLPRRDKRGDVGVPP